MLLSFIVDLKIREDNRVQILEFGPIQSAGFSGYKHVTGKDMREDIVFPFIEKNWHGTVFRETEPVHSISSVMEKMPFSENGLIINVPGYVLPGGLSINLVMCRACNI